MDLSRISTVIDTEKTQNVTVALIGTGGSADLACSLARCGVRRFVLVDPDWIEQHNVARQGHDAPEVGIPKVKALAKMIERINSEAEVVSLTRDFTAMTDEEIDAAFGAINLFIFATDSFAAQARGNQVALRLGVPALWVGLYRGGRAGEIIFWHPELDACFRCLTPKRFAAQANARAHGKSLDPPSDGATIFDIHLLDAIAGMLALGLLTRGSENRFGRLIEKLGDRNFLQIKIDPDWMLQDRDVVREQLGIAEECDSYFAWNTIVRRDPDRGQLSCPDCERFRGHTFQETHAGFLRTRSPVNDGSSSDTEPVSDADAMQPVI